MTLMLLWIWLPSYSGSVCI